MKRDITKKRTPLPVWAAVGIDLLMAALILLCFAFFHHVLPAMQPEAAPSPSPPPAASAAPAQALPELTAWQEKFADKFSQEPEITENSYKSPDISIEIQTVSLVESRGMITYHVADIYIAAPENFKTYTANGELKYFSTQNALEMDAASEAILAISGDFYSYQKSGLLVRNSQVYMDDEARCDICVMFPDGSIEMYSQGEYDKDELLARQPSQIWNFGPSLLDGEGKAKEHFNNVSRTVAYPNPRSALGYYEPGHYCFVVVDGRQEGYSAGMTLPRLAELFEELGCVSAYNLDGGGTAVMTFNDKAYSRQSNGADRELGDILLICESEVGK